ncbi:MAG: transcription antitermination factor NusB [Acidimicrobiia bacterium]|jgi:transcription antitermination factor NusB
MSGAGDPTVIPARVTVKGLARALDRPVPEVQGVLRARDLPDAPEDLLDVATVLAVAGLLGITVMIEPRDLALEVLYEYEVRGEVDADLEGRAAEIVSGVIRDLDELDRLIESVSEHWSVARMPLLDRNILRIGVFELRGEKVPTPVVVAEAVRLAQTYSTEKSAAFVNGVLATLAKTIRDG